MAKILSTSQRTDNLDAFLEHVLKDVADGSLSISDAKSGLAELIHLIDNRAEGGAVEWLEQGRKMIHVSI